MKFESIPLILGFWYMIALCMESFHGVGGVVDNLQLALLVVIAVSAVKHAVSVSRLVAELTVISRRRRIFLMLNQKLVGLLSTRSRCHNQICSCGDLPGHGFGKPPSEAEHSPPENR